MIIKYQIINTHIYFKTPLCPLSYFPTFLLFPSFYLELSNKVSIFAPTKVMIMSKKEKEEKAKEFWEYYKATQGTITITDPVVLD